MLARRLADKVCTIDPRKLEIFSLMRQQHIHWYTKAQEIKANTAYFS